MWSRISSSPGFAASSDPATSTIYTGAQVYDNIFNKLIDLDESNKFYGQLATKWTAPDDKTWVFDLVDNATFHNGEKFGPDDVVFMALARTYHRVLGLCDTAILFGLPDMFAGAMTLLQEVIDSAGTTGNIPMWWVALPL